MGLAHALLGASLLIAAAGARADDSQKAEREKLIGHWQLVTSQYPSGFQVKGEDWKLHTLEITAEQMIWRKDGRVLGQPETYRIDPEKSPKHIDALNYMNNQWRLGLYELDGDTLKLNPGNETKRPEKIEAIPGNSHHELRRIKVDPKPPAS
jgi:uncharacterized protein (TIGR03067 family)